MKFLSLIFLFGFAVINFQEALTKPYDGIVSNLRSVHEDLAEEFYRDEDLKTELGKKFQKQLEDALQKIKDAMEHGKNVGQDLLDKVKEINSKLKDIKVEVTDKAKELLEKIKNKSKDWWKKLLEKIGITKRDSDTIYNSGIMDIDIRKVFTEIRDKLKEDVDNETIKEFIREKLEKDKVMAEVLIQELDDLGRRAIIEMFDYLLIDNETRKLWKEMEDFMKYLKLDFKDEYLTFYKWVHDTIDSELRVNYGEKENIRIIAKELIKHSKDLSKEVASQGFQFLQSYKQHLEDLWTELKAALKV